MTAPHGLAVGVYLCLCLCVYVCKCLELRWSCYVFGKTSIKYAKESYLCMRAPFLCSIIYVGRIVSLEEAFRFVFSGGSKAIAFSIFFFIALVVDRLDRAFSGICFTALCLSMVTQIRTATPASTRCQVNSV